MTSYDDISALLGELDPLPTIEPIPFGFEQGVVVADDESMTDLLDDVASTLLEGEDSMADLLDDMAKTLPEPVNEVSVPKSPTVELVDPPCMADVVKAAIVAAQRVEPATSSEVEFSRLGECPVFGTTWAEYLRGKDLQWVDGNVMSITVGSNPTVVRNQVTALEKARKTSTVAPRSYYTVDSNVRGVSTFCARHMNSVTANASFVIHAVEMFREYERMTKGVECPVHSVMLPGGFQNVPVDVAKRGRSAALRLWCAVGAETLVHECRDARKFSPGPKRRALNLLKEKYVKLVGELNSKRARV